MRFALSDTPARARRSNVSRAWAFRRAIGLVLVSVGAHAIAATVPGSGLLLRQAQPPAVAPRKTHPGLTVEHPPAAGTSHNQVAFLVRRIEITGDTRFPAATLHALVVGAEGKLLTLAGLDRLAARITAYYHDHGYFLARAYIPAQTLRDGTVKIAVVEARYGAVVLRNRSGVSNRLLTATLAPLHQGAVVERKPLNRTLLLLSDIPGVVENATIRPGTATGTSDLLVNAVPGPSYDGYINLDNAGNRYTGRGRLGALLHIENPFHQGDRLSLFGLTSGPGLNFGRIGYQDIVNGEGTRLGVAFSDLAYRLTNDGASGLGAHGTAVEESLKLSQPAIRGVNSNLYVQTEYDHTRLHDQVDASNLLTDRQINSWTSTVAGDHRDEGGVTNYSASLTYANVGFENQAALAADAAGPDVRGESLKCVLSLARLQQLSSSNLLYLAFLGQLASKNLDPFAQFTLGGPGSVRAYGVTAAAGSQGALATIELRHRLQLAMPGFWQAAIFLDSGYVQVYKDAFPGSGSNSAVLSGVGVGLNWFGSHRLTVAASLAAPVGTTPVLVEHTPSLQGWLEITQGF